MKDRIKHYIRGLLTRTFRIFHSTGIYRPATPPVNFVVEKADWAIRWVGTYICKNIEVSHPGTTQVTVNPAPVINRLLHFGSQYQWLQWAPFVADDNRIVVSFFHGKRSDGDGVSTHIDRFLENAHKVDRIVTGAEMIRQRLVDWGIATDKVVRIPIGCDTNLFVPPSAGEKMKIRHELGIPANAFCIGSFQKDGVGWGEGREPKLIKGPDIFVTAVEKIAKQAPVFVLLTGPARGYVKYQLDRRNIPYRHAYIKEYPDLLRYYHALDLYLVTSREEGGPMALMEGMATHVPVISTRVGQAGDLLDNGVNGWLVEIDDVEGIYHHTMELLGSSEESRLQRLIRARDKVVKEFDWKIIAESHYRQVYQPLLN